MSSWVGDKAEGHRGHMTWLRSQSDWQNSEKLDSCPSDYLFIINASNSHWIAALLPQSTKLKRVGDLREHQTWRWRIWSLPCWFQVLLLERKYYAPFPPFANGNVYPVPLYVGGI